MTNKFYAHKTRYEGERKAQKPQLKTAPQHFVACKFVNTDGHRDGQTDRQTDSGTDKKGIWTTQATKKAKQLWQLGRRAEKKVNWKRKNIIIHITFRIINKSKTTERWAWEGGGGRVDSCIVRPALSGDFMASFMWLCGDLALFIYLNIFAYSSLRSPTPGLLYFVFIFQFYTI